MNARLQKRRWSCIIFSHMRLYLDAVLLFSVLFGVYAGSLEEDPEPYSSSPGFTQRNTVTLEYLTGIAGLLMDGGGIGFGYERVYTPWLAGRYVMSFGLSGSGDAHGTISLYSTGFGAVFYPASHAPRGLLVRTEFNLLYMAVFGEDLYDGLEAHHVVPTAILASGFRFKIGRKRIVVFLQPEVAYTFIFPGYTASGPAGNLEKGTTGMWAGLLHPNLIVGIGF